MILLEALEKIEFEITDILVREGNAEVGADLRNIAYRIRHIRIGNLPIDALGSKVRYGMFTNFKGLCNNTASVLLFFKYRDDANMILRVPDLLEEYVKNG